MLSSIIVMAALSAAPEANGAGIFNRRHHGGGCTDCAPAAPCNGCGEAAPCTGCGGAAPAAPGAAPTEPAKSMPKGDAPKGTTPTPAPAPAKKADAPKGDKAAAVKEAPIEIPAKLQEAINKSDQKQQILDYLRNPAVPRDKRVQYLETVRQTLLADTTKK